jgi:hypothetical protein
LTDQEIIESLRANPRLGDPAVVGTLDSLRSEECAAATKRAQESDPSLLLELAEWNRKYEAKFGYVSDV